MNDGIHVLDSSAMLCVIFQETGIEDVARRLDGALVSAVNVTEVFSKLQDRGMPDDSIEKILAGFKLTVVAFDEHLARMAGRLRNAKRGKGLSLGDRACLALAIARGAIAVTTDQAWQEVNCGARVLLVR